MCGVSTAGQSFNVWHARISGLRTMQIPLFGLHNVRNALAAIAVAHAVAIPAAAIAEGLLLFQGVKRRLEVLR